MNKLETTPDGQSILGLLAEDLQLLARLHDRELDADALEALNAITPRHSNLSGWTRTDSRCSNPCSRCVAGMSSTV